MMETIKMSGTPKRILERYQDHNGAVYVRIKFLDRHRTETIMTENEFERSYGKFN